MTKPLLRVVSSSNTSRAAGRWAVAASSLAIVASGLCLASASTASGSTGRKVGATGDCNSIATCYTPQQLQVAYGIEPLLARGIDGRGETVVLPELAYPLAHVAE